MATGVSKTKWKTAIAAPADEQAGDVCLTYKNKASEQDILATQPAMLVQAWPDEPVDANALYFGDNLPVLAALLAQPRLKGQVKLVYIDPPFATNAVFQSRAQADAYQDLLVGAPYIEYLRKRLVLLRELLAEDGSIYVHLDDNMAPYIKVVMDEVFGASNFRNWITRRKCSHKNYTKKNYGNISDSLLFYTKSDRYTWNRSMEEWTPERARKEYPCIEQTTGRRYKKVPIHAPGARNGETGKAWRGMLPPPGKHWQYTPQTLDEMEARGEIYWSPTGNPRRKVYLEASEGVAIQDIWHDFRDTRNQNVFVTGYPTEKNCELLERIIKASSNPGDLVLDCFCGSGTTLAVASQLGRTWIGVDNSLEAVATTGKRLRHGLERMGDYVTRLPQTEEAQANIPTALDLFPETPTTPVQNDKTGICFTLHVEARLAEHAGRIIQEW